METFGIQARIRYLRFYGGWKQKWRRTMCGFFNAWINLMYVMLRHAKAYSCEMCFHRPYRIFEDVMWHTQHMNFIHEDMPTERCNLFRNYLPWIKDEHIPCAMCVIWHRKFVYICRNSASPLIIITQQPVLICCRQGNSFVMFIMTKCSLLRRDRTNLKESHLWIDYFDLFFAE